MRVTLEWNGADIENDIVGYELYFSATSHHLKSLVASPSASFQVLKRSGVASGIQHIIGSVITKDGEGNSSSDSGIFVFKVFIRL